MTGENDACGDGGGVCLLALYLSSCCIVNCDVACSLNWLVGKRRCRNVARGCSRLGSLFLLRRLGSGRRDFTALVILHALEFSVIEKVLNLCSE